MAKAPLSWQAPEYYHRHKTTDWYWAVGIIVVVAAGVSIFLGNVLFAILIVLGAFSLITYAARAPRIVHITISESGITIGNTRYPFSNLASFWVDEHDQYSKLIVDSKKAFVPHLVVPLIDVSPEAVRDFLREHLPEVEQHEPLIQLLMEYVGF